MTAKGSIRITVTTKTRTDMKRALQPQPHVEQEDDEARSKLTTSERASERSSRRLSSSQDSLDLRTNRILACQRIDFFILEAQLRLLNIHYLSTKLMHKSNLNLASIVTEIYDLHLMENTKT